jgi:hypothetical protein
MQILFRNGIVAPPILLMSEDKITTLDLTSETGSEGFFTSLCRTSAQCPEWELVSRGGDRGKTCEAFLGADTKGTSYAFLTGLGNGKKVSIDAMP